MVETLESATTMMADMVKVQILCTVFLMILSYVGAVKCPCQQPSLCKPLRKNNTREIFMFATHGTNRSEYVLFDWGKITTLALTKYVDDDIICYGHSKGVKVVLMVGFVGNQLTNISARDAWVTMVTKQVQDHYMDGVHLDFEDLIHQNEPEKREALTKLFLHLKASVKSLDPTLQVTIDVNSDPDVPDHHYDYAALIGAADFVFLRTYDQRRWVIPSKPCFAWAMDANNVTIQGLKNFERLGVPGNKVILGFAWYGFDYGCQKLSNNVCFVERQGKRCTCAKPSAYNTDYSIILEKLVPISSGGIQRDPVSGAPFITYKDNQTDHWRQVWFNDPKSLRSRYALADEYNLLGVGAWVLKDLDYSRTPYARNMRRQMWNALPNW